MYVVRKHFELELIECVIYFREQRLLEVWLNSCDRHGITGKIKWEKQFHIENLMKEFVFLLDTWFTKVNEMS